MVTDIELLTSHYELMTSLVYPKSYEFKIIWYTTHSINREKDDHNLTFHFFNTSFCSTQCIQFIHFCDWEK